VFRIIGAIVGYVIYGFIGAILGFFVGGLVGRVLTLGPGGANPFTLAQRQAVFLETLFVLTGRLAKADGQVSQHEIDHTEHFMRQLGMTAEHRQQAIAWFKQGADPAFDVAGACQHFLAACGHTRSLKQTLLVYLISSALADGHLHPAEDALLVEIAGRLGFDETSLRHLLEMVVNQARFGAGQASQAGAAEALDNAYKALGVTPDSSDAEVKRAYRKLMSQNHPDKLIGQGMPEDMVALATEQAKEIQLAYDLITRSRAAG